MSMLIEMSQISEQVDLDDLPPDNIEQAIRQTLKAPQFELRDFSYKNGCINAFLGRGFTTFIRDTRWLFSIQKSYLKLVINIIDSTGMNYLSAKSQRVKLEVMILLKFLNQKLSFEEQFFIDPDNGIFKYCFAIQWRQYRIKIPKIEYLKRFFRYLLNQLNLYSEIIYLCEPFCQEKQFQPTIPKIYDEHLKAINQYRLLLRNTKKFRELNSASIKQILELKQLNRQNPVNQALKMELDHMLYLYQSNIHTFHQMRIGLDSSQENCQSLIKCCDHALKNARGEESKSTSASIKDSNSAKKDEDSNKIVKGILIFKPLGQQKIISKEGAHSQIFRGGFCFKLAKTINQQVFKNDPVWITGDQQKGQFTFKRCNLTAETSKNSFMNEIYLLNYLRDSKSSYIGKYFLQVKSMKDRGQDDVIYMKSYNQNLDFLIKKCKTLSVHERLTLAYRISKGMCFLSSKSILHRDLKPHNIVVDNQLNPYVIDFGSCAPVQGSKAFNVRDNRLLTTRFFHVYYHQIPEDFAFITHKFTKDQYNTHPLFDVYSFGRVLCFTFFNTLQIPNPDQLEIHPYRQLLKNILFIATLCLQIDPDQRPTFGQIASFLGSLSKFCTAFQQQILGKQKRSISEQKDYRS